MGTCEVCGASIKRKGKRWCSKECRFKRPCECSGCLKPTYGHRVCPMHQKRMEAWGSYDAHPPKNCVRCSALFTPSNGNDNCCSNSCRRAVRVAYNGQYFSNADKRAELALNRKRKETPESRERKRIANRARYDRYAAFNRTSRRRAKRSKVPVTIFESGGLELRMSMFNFSCWICGGPFEAIDHVKPIAAGGPHMLSNLRPTCAECNARKWSSWPIGDVETRFTAWENVNDDFIATSRITSGFASVQHAPILTAQIDGGALQSAIRDLLKKHQPRDVGCACLWRARPTGRGHAEHQAIHIVKLLHREGAAS